MRTTEEINEDLRAIGVELQELEDQRRALEAKRAVLWAERSRAEVAEAFVALPDADQATFRSKAKALAEKRAREAAEEAERQRLADEEAERQRAAEEAELAKDLETRKPAAPAKENTR